MAESLQQIKSRIKGIKNINQITKAMELVAATKMRKSQEIALNSRPYAFAALDLLGNLSRLENVALPPLLEKREIKKTAIVVATSDKGLCGSFNGTVIREFERFIAQEKIDLKDPAYSFIAVGQKAAAYLEKRTELAEKFIRVGDYTALEEVEPLANFLTVGYLKGDWDKVIVFSMNFRSALRQEVLERQIFPVEFDRLKETARELTPATGKFSEMIREGHIAFFNNEKITTEYIIEPSPEIVMEELAAHLVLMQIYHIILEANASEHAARRVAMKNASDNAEELASKFTLAYNKSRQASITREIIEIVAGSEA